MDIKPRSIIVFLLIFAFVYFVIKFVSFYWLIVLFNVILIFINSVFLFAYLEVRPAAGKPPEKWPSVSIVIPNYNGAKTLAKCVTAVKNLEYPVKKEIIVVDDGSKDNSLKILEKIKGVRVIAKKKNAGKAAALNSGINVAVGELVVTIDSDTYPDPDCLMKMVPRFEGDVCAVTGFVKAANTTGIIEKIQEVEYLIAFGFFQSVLSDINAVLVTPGPMSVFKRDILQKLGGFDEKNITEDMEVALRLRKHGYRIVACMDAFIFTEVPTTLKHLFRQRVRWYRGKFANTWIYRELLCNPKYGEFGTFTFPFSVVLEWCIVLFVFVFLAGNLDSLLNYISYVFVVVGVSSDFSNLLPSISAVNPSFYFYILGACFYAVFLYLSHNLAGDKIRVSKLPEIALFILVYGFFILTVFFVGFFKEINSSEYRW